MADINIQAIEKLTKLDKRVTLISDNTAKEMHKILSRIDKLEIAVDELRSRERSQHSRRRNRRNRPAIGGRRTRRGRRKKRTRRMRKSKGRKRRKSRRKSRRRRR